MKKRTTMKRWFSIVLSLLMVFSMGMQVFASTYQYSNGSYTMSFDDADGAISQTVREQIVNIFNTVYPQMAAEYNPSAPKHLTLKVDRGYSGVAYTSGSTIIFSADYLNANPSDTDCATHEMMHAVQQYSTSSPLWLIEGIADYARYKYGLYNNQSGWSLPAYSSSQKYTDSYRVTARFLVWIEKYVKSGLVKEMDSRLRARTYSDGAWSELTGKTVDQLWSAYAADPSIDKAATTGGNSSTSVTAPDAQGVSVYNDINYGGNYTTLDIGRYNMADLSARGMANDTITSVKVPAGYKVTLYNDINFAGTTVELTADSSYLGDFNDKTTSLVVSLEGAAVYKDINFGGTKAVLGVGSYNMADLVARGIPNDSITSVKVASGYKVTLYNDINFAGTTMELTADSSYLGNFNDKTTSLKVEKVTSAPSTDNSGSSGNSSAGNSNNNTTTSPSGGSSSGGAFLKTDGTVIRNNNGTGDIVNLRGTNLGGWLLQENWMSPLGCQDELTLRSVLTGRFGEATALSLIDAYQDAWLQSSDLDNIKSYGMNFVRVPVLYLELVDDNGNFRSGAWDRLDWLIDQCSQKGLYVVIDLHGTFGGQNMLDNCGQVNSDPQLWKNSDYQDKTVKIWQGIASRYKDNPTVAGYDLLNEPDRVSTNQLAAFYDRLYKAIRAIDNNHIIIMEGAWHWNMLVDPATYGWENIVYEMHFYAMDGNQASDWNAQNNLVNTKLADLAYYQELWNVPLYVGEFNVFDFNDLWEKFMSGFNALNVSWSNWTYKVSSNYGNWGFYNNSSAQTPNIYSDSADAIRSKWSGFTTSSCNANTTLQNLVKKYTNAVSAPVTSGGGTTNAYYALVAAANDLFVSANEDGSVLEGNRETCGYWEMYQIVNNSDGTISLRARSNGKYVQANPNKGGELKAVGEHTESWEKFEKEDYGNGQFALKSVANGKYVKIDLDNGCYASASSESIGGAWETFSFKRATDGMKAEGTAIEQDQNYYALISDANNLFVSASEDGSVLEANRETCGYWEMYQVVKNSDGTISLKARSNGKYVQANADGNGELLAAGESVGTWERFKKEEYGNSQFALKSVATGKYVKADLDNGGRLSAVSDSIGGAWETFSFKEATDGMKAEGTAQDQTYYTLTSCANGKYSSANEDGSALEAVKNTCGYWEMYQVIKNSDGTISLKARSNGKYVQANFDNGAKLQARGDSIGTWERFEKVEYGNGEFALKSTVNNCYVKADLDNGGVLVAVSDSIGGAWESFKFEEAEDGMTNGSTDDSVNPYQDYALTSMANGMFCSANEDGGSMEASKSVCGHWEMYQIVNNGDGTISLKAKSNGKYIYADLNNGGKLVAEGNAVGEWERFEKVEYGNDEFALKCKANGKYVKADLDNNGQLYASSDSIGGAWESFKLGKAIDGMVSEGAVKYDGKTFHIINKNSNLVLDIHNSSNDDGADIIQWTDNGGPNQKWTFKSAGDGTYYIVSVQNGKVLDVYHSSNDDGGKIVSWSKNGNDNQRWYVTDLGNGYVKIINKNSGKALDMSGWSKDWGGKTQQWTYEGQANQQWKLEKV